MAPLLPNPVILNLPTSEFWVFSLHRFLLNFYLCLLDLKIRAATRCRCDGSTAPVKAAPVPSEIPHRKTAGKTARGGKPMVHEDILASGAFTGEFGPVVHHQPILSLPQTTASYESVLNSAQVSAHSTLGFKENCILVNPESAQERQSQQVSQHPNKSPEPSNSTPNKKRYWMRKNSTPQRVLTTCPRRKF
ncbi:hypothetical protein C8F04DRAFT_1144198 [Mycena alexandri]|uniref:Uncharacterized protein n=1 Tax=Mycena alexandri TaxID=1745969 RepID=A0AAD6WPL8_9AGAR|nr:hypothetical protein C8F04DRAFT_1144198 [Mycena alexandri]